QRSLEDQVGEEDGRLQRVSDGVAQAALPLQPGVLRGAGCGLRVHEQQHTKLLCLGPERIELSIGELLAFYAPSDRSTTQAQLSDRLVQLISCEVRMLQRQCCHSDEAIGMLRTPLRDLVVLKLDQVPSQRAVRRVAPGVDVDRLIVDALGI